MSHDETWTSGPPDHRPEPEPDPDERCSDCGGRGHQGCDDKATRAQTPDDAVPTPPSPLGAPPPGTVSGAAPDSVLAAARHVLAVADDVRWQKVPPRLWRAIEELRGALTAVTKV